MVGITSIKKDTGLEDVFNQYNTDAIETNEPIEVIDSGYSFAVKSFESMYSEFEATKEDADIFSLFVENNYSKLPILNPQEIEAFCNYSNYVTDWEKNGGVTSFLDQ